ncbi:FmdB family zinc ribbon protein [Luteimonas wenzhouensis]|jgi:putative FmdB family regulatory protein|uniref:Zinc ribbon domain-containing protein n=1 Tax=Luteimonas wenzhouensis TaxID=2599615 RepID=A0A5C5U6I9_9GAMM|nr:zinc ribbon domain-containing protein [Luteimonas wenzhouensis]NLW97847.1 zinc ribbon domain-containing protein [Xanthomonadaceae bacterium]TWT22031.1 zinc ribbon domain-containing protein [Luteimonas wenzhouensis]
MPIYAFRCEQCEHSFDRLQKLSDPDPEACPACGGAQVRREVTAPAFRLAGTGWYETDFKKDGDRKRNLADAGDGGGKSEGGSAASKPEAKADTPARSADAASSAAPATA